MDSITSNCLPTGYAMVSCSTDFRAWRRRRHVPLELRSTCALHGAISQKMVAYRRGSQFLVTAQVHCDVISHVCRVIPQHATFMWSTSCNNTAWMTGIVKLPALVLVGRRSVVAGYVTVAGVVRVQWSLLHFTVSRCCMRPNSMVPCSSLAECIVLYYYYYYYFYVFVTWAPLHWNIHTNGTQKNSVAWARTNPTAVCRRS
jgi:hypothetical protein